MRARQTLKRSPSLRYSGSMNDPFDVADLLRWRADRDEFFRAHYASPIPEDHLASFTGLRYFDPDPAFVLEGAFSGAEGKVEIASSTGSATEYSLAGHIALEFGSTAHRLVVLHGEEDELFVPFRDGTSGVESYGGGRYAPVVVSRPGRAMVDFNRAVNPYCAYDEEFSCPLPPRDNWLDVRVTAGEMHCEEVR